jgi:hypothetical protein
MIATVESSDNPRYSLWQLAARGRRTLSPIHCVNTNCPRVPAAQELKMKIELF